MYRTLGYINYVQMKTAALRIIQTFLRGSGFPFVCIASIQ